MSRTTTRRIAAGHRNTPTLGRRLSLAMDNVFALFSEKKRFERIQARNAADILAAHAAKFAYDGAEKGHRHKNWLALGGSADADLDEDTLDTLRDRSRERMQNTGLANSIISSIQENVVGSGLEPELDPDGDRLGISDGEVEELRGQADEVWNEWGPHADAQGRAHMADLQALVLASVLVNGDCGAVPINVPMETRGEPSPLGLKVDLIEGDRIANPFGLTSDDGVRVVNGVSLGRRNQPLAYWVARQHPGDDLPASVGARTYRRIRRHNPDGSLRFLHLYWQKRIGQTRGEPIFSSVLSDFKDLGDWKEAELVASQVAACFAVFVTKENPFDAAVAAARGNTASGGEREEEVVPGQIYYGEPGESVTSVTPGRPNGLFESFYGAVARQIASATGIPLEVAMRDFRDSNYSQSRAALLEARKCFAARQTWLVRYFLQPIFDRVLFEAWLRGKFAAGDFLARRHLWTKTNWNTPGWGHIDEEKSMRAAELGLKMRVTSRTRIASALHGGRWSAINRQLAREEAQIAEVAQEDGGGENNAEKSAALANKANAYGVAVRAGAITPQIDDEEATRAEFGLPPMSDAAREAWEAEATRRPITLAPASGSGLNPAVEDDEDEDDVPAPAPPTEDSEEEAPDDADTNDDEETEEGEGDGSEE